MEQFLPLNLKMQGISKASRLNEVFTHAIRTEISYAGQNFIIDL